MRSFAQYCKSTFHAPLCDTLLYTCAVYIILASVRALTSIASSSNLTHIHCAIIQAARNVQRIKRARGLNSLLWVWSIGMAKTNATIVALVATTVRFLAKLCLFFFAGARDDLYQKPVRHSECFQCGFSGHIIHNNSFAPSRNEKVQKEGTALFCCC